MGVVGVSGDWLYAVGDTTGRGPLTHMGQLSGPDLRSRDRGARGGRPLDCSRYRDLADDGKVPRVTFTHP